MVDIHVRFATEEERQAYDQEQEEAAARRAAWDAKYGYPERERTRMKILERKMALEATRNQHSQQLSQEAAAARAAEVERQVRATIRRYAAGGLSYEDYRSQLRELGVGVDPIEANPARVGRVEDRDSDR